MGVGSTSASRAMLIGSVTNKGGVRPDLVARGGGGIDLRAWSHQGRGVGMHGGRLPGGAGSDDSGAQLTVL